MREELGIEIEINDLIGVGHSFNPNWKGKRNYAVQVYFECFPKSDNLKPSSDVVDVKWVKEREIGKYLKDIEHTLPNDLKIFLNNLDWK